MRRVRAGLAVFLAVTAFTGSAGFTGAVASAASSASPARGTWSRFMAVPGLGDLSPGVNETLTAISCTGPGDCTAGGADNSTDPTHASSLNQAWVASEASGTWGSAQAVPGTATLNTSSGAATTAVSCSWPGNCVAAGYADYQYSKTAVGTAGFVVNEVNGIWGTARPVRTWRRAQQVPGTATLNAGGNASVTSVSCRAAGSCAAAGTYRPAKGPGQLFVVNEGAGQWKRAIQLPGSGKFITGNGSAIGQVSCASATFCGVGGTLRAKAAKGSSRSSATAGGARCTC